MDVFNMHLFLRRRTPAFSPCRIFSFFVMLFLLMCVHKRVIVEIGFVWLRREIYQHNNVVSSCYRTVSSAI